MGFKMTVGSQAEQTGKKMCLYLFIVNYECFLLGYLLSDGMNKASSFYKG